VLDVRCFLTMADLLARRIPGAQRIDVPDSGHMVTLEAPDTVNALLRKAIHAQP
jgi:pimeloyl-ACP methyl ester carboxylesterase